MADIQIVKQSDFTTHLSDLTAHGLLNGVINSPTI